MTTSKCKTTTRVGTTGITIRRLFFPLVLGCLFQACGGNDLLLPSAGQPAKISVLSGDHQTGTVGEELDDPIVVLVTDPEDRPVADVEVAFVPPEGGDLAPNDTVVTGPDGKASVRYRLSPAAGDQVIEARAKPVVQSADLTTTITASANPEAAVSLVLASGDGQVGVVSTALPESLVVRAVDRFGNGVAGVEVHWEASGGSVSPETVVTGADGRAAAERVMGDNPGSYPTRAEAGDLSGSPLSFTSNAMAAPSPALILLTYPPSTARAGVPFDQQPELQLEDPSGAPLNRADVTVTAAINTGSGSVGGEATATSDANGRVKFTNLSIRGAPGRRIMIFAAEGFTSALSSSIVVSPGPADARESSASVPNGTAGETTVISIELHDEFGSSVEGEAGAVDIEVNGPNQQSGIEVSDKGGGNYSASYTPKVSGTDEVNIRIHGDLIAGNPLSSTVKTGPASPAKTTVTVIREGAFIYTYTVLVSTQDAQGNVLRHGGDHVQVQPIGGDIRDAQDVGDGTYISRFASLNPDQKSNIFLNGDALPGNPYSAP